MTALQAHRIRAYLAQTWANVRQHYVPLCQLLLLCSAVFAPFVITSREPALDLNRTAMFLAAGVFLLGIVQRIIGFTLCALLAANAAVILHIQRQWGAAAQQLDARIEAYLESTPNEIGDYVRAHFELIDLVLVAALAAYLALLVLFFRFRHRQLRCFRSQAVLALLAWLGVYLAFDVQRRATAVAPIEFIAGLKQAFVREQQLEARRSFIVNNALEPRSCSSTYDKIVIVIGESALPDRMSVYGYGRATTPFADRSGPQALRALAPSNQTRYSVAMMLTPASPGDFEGYYQSHSLVSELRACGYHTTWISNQGRIGKHDSFVTSLAREADEQIFLNRLSYQDATHDGVIVAELDRRNIYGATGQATFIHLIGSHSQYERRYPASFGATEKLDNAGAYDLSILYTDTILAQLFEKFQGGKLLFVYVSDHGQVVSDERSGSGFDPAYKEEFRTPLLIWTDDRAALREVVAAIGTQWLNLDSFAELVQFFTGLRARPDISTSSTVSVLSPEVVVRYEDLATFGDRAVANAQATAAESESNE